jgi:putative PIN family toxin of toxin-antitoxin system
MPRLKIVLDTNAFLRTVSRRSDFSIVLDKLKENFFELWVTNEILLEYEEKITNIFLEETAEFIIAFLSLLPNVRKTDVFYRLNLITADEDDNKFCDCAFAANVHYLVTNDKHFNVLKPLGFPTINVITLEEFKNLLEGL